jgi:hypothetical protein
MTQDSIEVPPPAEAAVRYAANVGSRVRGVMHEYGVRTHEVAEELDQAMRISRAMEGAKAPTRPRSQSYVHRRLRGLDGGFTVEELYIVASLCNRRRPDWRPVTLTHLLDVMPRFATVAVTGGQHDLLATAA